MLSLLKRREKKKTVFFISSGFNLAACFLKKKKKSQLKKVQSGIRLQTKLFQQKILEGADGAAESPP